MIAAPATLAQALDRIAREDHRWHAMLALNPDAGPATPGPLHGMVLAVKDNIDVAGLPTSSGCRALAQGAALADAPVVTRLRAAGAVVVGKTNLSEFSFEIRSKSSLGGDVLCPYAPDATAGGSSGGSAVAVARGFATAALGTDTGGSIRIPASCNGLVGLRPAHGVLPMAGIAPLAPSTDTVGPLTRSVGEARLLYTIMGGPIGGAVPLRPRVGVLRQAFGQDPRILAACEGALARLAAAGVEVVDPCTLPDVEALLEGPHIVDAEFASAFDAYLARRAVTQGGPASLDALVAGGDFLPDHRPVLIARMETAPDPAPILARHRDLTAMLHAMMVQHQVDALFYPTMRVIPEGLGNPPGGWAPELAARSGWPAITVPAAAPGQRPVGVELLVPARQEATLFALATLLEQR